MPDKIRWEKVRELSDGTKVTVRSLGPEDKEEVRKALLALSEETKIRRFLSAYVEPTDAMLDYLTNVDQKNHIAIVATIASPDLKDESGIGVARFIRSKDDPHAAEAAITVVDGWQRRGVGRVLLKELVKIAQRRGILHFRAEIMKDNLAIVAILEQAAAKLVAETDTTATFDVAINPKQSPRLDIFALFRLLAAAFRRII